MINDFLLLQLVFAALVLGYDILLRSNNHFKFNRMLLVAFPVLSLLFVWIPQLGVFQSLSVLQVGLLPVISVSASQEVSNSVLSVSEIAWAAYLLVVVVLIVRNGFRLINSYFTSNQIQTEIDGFKVILTEKESHSLINRLFLSKKDLNEPLIIEHELSHLRQKHWMDLFFAQLLTSIFWLNPMVWRWSVLIRQNHEFLADTSVSKSYDFGKTEYIHLLLDKAFKTNQFSLGNYFSMHSLISKRINMLNKNKKQKTWKLAAISLVIIGIGFIVGACAKAEPEKEVNVKKVIVKKTINADGEVVTETETTNETRLLEEGEEEMVSEQDIEQYLPTFKGGQEAMMNFMATELKYPEVCKNEGIEGMVVLSFVVSETGEVLNSKVAKSVHKDLDDEALRVLALMPDWKPGTVNGKPTKMEMKLPVRYKMKKS